MQVRICRNVAIPDNLKLARFKKSPDFGPKVLFFSGGSALRGVSRSLIHYTHNSIHIITAFDSGGSSAKLREAFHMPAIGDVRARLMDLADQSLQGNREIFELFAFRFPKQGSNRELTHELDKMVNGKHRLISRILDPMRKIIRNHLYWFREKMPSDFDLRGASIGNLILTAGYLENRRHLDPVIYIFSKLVRVRGTVRPIANKYLHLAAELENGKIIVGQHLLTGKEVKPIASKISKLFITDNPVTPRPYTLKIRKKMKNLINNAELICYPMGSFFSSILANFLVDGAGKAIASNNVPKIYIPNTTIDPECFGYSLMDQVDALVRCGCENDPNIKINDLINIILIDRKNGSYQGKIDKNYFSRRSIQIIDCPLISRTSKPYIDEKLILPVLLTLC
jgi:CofD-related protein of GAK system